MPARRVASGADPPGYPRELIRTVQVDWGATLRIRPIRPDDEAELRAFFERLSTRTVFQRFFRAWRKLPDEWYPRFVQVDYAQRLALVAEVDGADGARLLGVARYEPTDTDGVAEVALVVEDSWQGQGLGRRLLEALLDAAAARGIHRFRADALSDNRRILKLLAETVSIESSSTEQGVTELTFVRKPRGPNDDYFRGATTTSVGEPLR
jgi:acetyltransferase